MPCDVGELSPNGDLGWKVTLQPGDASSRGRVLKEATTFSESLRALPVYISHSYDNFELYIPAWELSDQLAEHPPVLVATNGGAIPNKGSLGWVITDALVNALARGYGITSGSDPQSYRAELSALLAATRFILHSHVHHATSLLTAPATVYTDSKSMDIKLQAMHEYPKASHKIILDADWNLLQALHSNLCTSPTYPRIVWVPSHQDTTNVPQYIYDAFGNVITDDNGIPRPPPN